MDDNPDHPFTGGRPTPLVAATRFVQHHFPRCVFAVLAGSAAHGEPAPLSDLDLVVIAADEQPRWATYLEWGWPIEVFILTPTMYRAAFARNVQRRRPLLPILCVEGIVLVDRDGCGSEVRAEARRLLDAGPAPLSHEETAEYRYALTWMRDDLADAEDADEARLIGHDVATTAAQCYLAYRRHWVGRGKWLLRDLRDADPARAHEFAQALGALYRHGHKASLLAFADAILQLVGGRRFEGQEDPWG